ncbi:MFS transporter [Gordonia jinhuaensis]|uniref:MFS transporter n=1 Tax=Gordonia jinhuaensis TaxID=1517702 RepID=A0A916WZW3_9ACTN|nr:MFS transporter [Gordonia jinhuaensis]GGB42481.1 MFS transporter [Gordonia jinhuaensis]
MTRRWSALVALCFAELMVMIDNTIVNVALPTISRDLDAGISGLQWVVDAYTLVFAGLLLAGGHLGDRYGRKGMLLIGIVGFGGVSAVAASSTTVGALIASRGALGVFAALVFPGTLALVISIFNEPRTRAAAVGIWAATSGVAVAIGPVLGGWLLEHYSWASVFWVNVPMAVAAVIAVALVVPADRHRHAGPFDPIGLLTSIAGVGLLTYSVIEGPHHGWTNWRTLGGLVLAVLILAAFAIYESRSRSPIFDVRLFGNRRFAMAAALISLAFFSLMGFIFLITQYFQAVKGYGTLEAGLRTLPFAVVMAVLSPVAMVGSRRLGAGRVAAVGSALMAAGFLLVEVADRDTAYWGIIVLAMSLMAAGLAFISGPCADLVMASLRPEQTGAGSAVNDTTRELGGTLGVAVLGSVLTSAYTASVTHGLTDIPLPAAAREATTESVMAGVEVAKAAPTPWRQQILDVVQTSFVDGLHNASWVAAGVMAVATPLAWVLLAHNRTRDIAIAGNDDQDSLPASSSPATERSSAAQATSGTAISPSSSSRARR